MADHELMGGRLHVYKRENSRYWQCSTYLGGQNRRVAFCRIGHDKAMPDRRKPGKPRLVDIDGLSQMPG